MCLCTGSKGLSGHVSGQSRQTQASLASLLYWSNERASTQCDHSLVLAADFKYTQKNARSVTAFNSTDIRSVQDNVATPVTAMMVTVSLYQYRCLMICIHLSWFIWYQQLPSLLLVHHACSYRLQQSVPNIPVSFCYIRLIQPWQPNRLFQSDTISSEQYLGNNSLIQLWYHICIRPEGATGCNRSVAFLCV